MTCFVCCEILVCLRVLMAVLGGGDVAAGGRKWCVRNVTSCVVYAVVL
jgi:hypothetical protein